MKLLVLALSTARQHQVLLDIAYARDRGAEATLVTTKPEAWERIDGVDVIGLAEHEGRHWFLRGERGLIIRLPNLLVRALRKVFVILGKLPGPIGAPFRRIASSLGSMVGRLLKASKSFHVKHFGPFYRNLRPFVLWRVFRQKVLPTLDIASYDIVVVGDTLSTPIGWHLARAHPDLHVRHGLDREHLAALAA